MRNLKKKPKEEKNTVRMSDMQTWPKIGYFGNRTINFSVPLCHQIYYRFAMHSTCLGADRAGPVLVAFNLRANEMKMRLSVCLFVSFFLALFSLRLFCILNSANTSLHAHALAHTIEIGRINCMRISDRDGE